MFSNKSKYGRKLIKLTACIDFIRQNFWQNEFYFYSHLQFRVVHKMKIKTPKRTKKKN